ncbi:[protein-PII] uridylyltransferase [Acidithiobacillus sp.]
MQQRAIPQARRRTDTLHAQWEQLRLGREALRQGFLRGVGGAPLLAQHCRLVDGVLREIWRQLPARLQVPRPAGLALVAVGGYGRGELFPDSDIDLLILGQGPATATQQAFVEAFLTALWDLQLQVGHSFRTPAECMEEARGDLGIATTLLEMRFLVGARTLVQQLQQQMRTNPPWPPALFFAAKIAEQEARHARFSDTAYHLEPQIKDGPGGLRDLHQLQWLAWSSLGDGRLRHLQQAGIINAGEYRQLLQARNFLSRLRIGLHYAAGRREDRLRLDLQPLLAAQLGFQDTADRSAVEHLMQNIYRIFASIARISAIAQENLAWRIAPAATAAPLVEDDIALRQDSIGFAADHPAEPTLSAILKLFRRLAEDPQQRGLDAATQRELHALRRHLQPQMLRNDPRARSDLLAILAKPEGVYRTLSAMHQCGILARLLPAFGHITGQIQHDLFHVYTVDQHTLFLLRQVGRFWTAGHSDLPVIAEALLRIDRPELLVIAGIFHDIAKGRGGDHSRLGAREVKRFAHAIGLDRADTRFLAWLVQHHLDMSGVSQRRDLEDPRVIQDFARMVGDERRLSYLLLLTIADMRATNPDLWNDWKGMLLSTLYRGVRSQLQRNTIAPKDRRALLRAKKRDLLAALPTQAQAQAQALWRTLGNDYFMRYGHDELLWHTQSILQQPGQRTLVLARPRQPVGTELLIYGRDTPGLFLRITSALDKQSLSILDARIDTSADGHALDTFIVLDESHAFAHSPDAHQDLGEHLRAIIDGEAVSVPRFGLRHHGARHRFFAQNPVVVTVDNAALQRYTLLEVTAADRLGLLYQVGEVLLALHLSIHGAKVSTFGERVEDTFFILDENGKKLAEGQRERLRSALLDALQQKAA